MFWPQCHHLPKQGGNLSPLDRESLRLTSFGLAKAHRANENALRTWIMWYWSVDRRLLLFASSDRCRRSLATWLWQLHVFRLKMYGSVKWIVDLHKRSLVALYEKNSKPVRSRGLKLYLAKKPLRSALGGASGTTLGFLTLGRALGLGF